MGSKNIFLQNERGEYDLKVERMQNAPYFPHFLEKFMLQTSCSIALLNNLFKIHGFHGTHGTHANAATEFSLPGLICMFQ